MACHDFVIPHADRHAGIYRLLFVFYSFIHFVCQQDFW